jgi:hypothetical protein
MSRNSGGYIALPRIYSGSYLSHSLTCNINFSKGHLCISGFGYSGIPWSKNDYEHILKTYPSATLPARPALCFEDAFEL